MGNKERFTKYHTNIQPRLEEIASLARGGNTDKQIAQIMGVGYSTFQSYIKQYLELREALKESKGVVDAQVEKALLERCIERKITVMKAVKLKEITYDNGKKLTEIERVEMCPEESVVPADPRSIIFWLTNRRPEEWQSRVDTSVRNADGKEFRIVMGQSSEEYSK